MAVSVATVHTVSTDRSTRLDPFQIARILFTIPPTQVYAQADNGILQNVGALISASRRNGRTVALKTVMLYQPARKEVNQARFMALKTLAIAGADITFEVTEGAVDKVVDYATELANGAVPEQAEPFGILVGFEETGP